MDRSATVKQWQPPDGLAPDEILAIIDAASTERDRLLLRVLWATAARISEALALRPMDTRRDSPVLPNLKNPSRLTKRVFLPAGQMDLPGALLLRAKEHGIADGEPLFFSRKRAPDGGRRPISRQQAWEIVRAAATSSRRRPVTRRCRPYFGRPARSGVTLARRDVRNSRISLSMLTVQQYAHLVEPWEVLAIPL